MKYIWIPEAMIKLAIVFYVASILASRLAMAIDYAGLASIIE